MASSVLEFMTQMVFIDLEQTVIDDWWSATPINLHLRSELSGKDVIIFSFALLNLQDKIEFNKRIKPEIEQVFGCKIIDAVLMSDVTKEIALKFNNLHFFDVVDEIDYRNTLGKQDLFLRYCQKFSDSAIFLFDDMVDNIVVLDKLRKNRITLVKV